MTYTRPRPRPAQAQPAYDVISVADREALAAQAQYVGSPYHTDVPKYQIEAHPRGGAIRIQEAEANRLKNPSCTLCPRKWVRRQEAATALLQAAIRNGQFEAAGPIGMPPKVWARDPDEDLIYEAKLAYPPNGYKAYPLTSFQAEFGLPIKLP